MEGKGHVSAGSTAQLMLACSEWVGFFTANVIMMLNLTHLVAF